MSAMLPPEMLPFTGLLTIALVWPRLRAQPSPRRLVAEALGLAFVAIALVWSAWVLLWLVEQRW
jgi:hypothetical protein